MSGLNAGDLDREIVLQTAAKVQSDSGEETFDWDNAVEATVWAQWLPAGTAEAWKAQQRLGSYVNGVFHIYDREPRPTPDDTRILFDGRVFDTNPYVEIGRGDGLAIPVMARGE
jgi:head-tail adaptor